LDFAKVLRAVVAFFEEEGAAFAVIGAFGLHTYGLTRATLDLDFVADGAVQPRLVSFLESLGYETLYLSAGYSNHLNSNLEMGRLDFVYVTGETSRLLFESAKKRLLHGGISIPVPKPEHLAAMKIQAMKNDPGRTFQEMADLQFLMGLPDVDLLEVRSYFEKQGLLENYNEIKRQLKGAEPGS
jgi:hypothetical protein